jgi:hypothetical protein
MLLEDIIMNIFGICGKKTVKNGVACNVGLKCELATHVIRFEF